MTVVDEIFQEAGNEKKVGVMPFDKEEWASQKQKERETVFQMIEEATLESVGSEESLKTVLDVMAHFDRYSVGNVLLIAKQKPEATKLASFDSWKDAGAFVKKGETGILILGPSQEYTKEDGTAGVNFVTKKMFDISQTSSHVDKASEPIDERNLLAALLYNPPCEISVNEDAKYSVENFTTIDRENNVIYVRHGCSQGRLFQELTRQMAYIQLDKSEYKFSDRDFIAACASYVLCKRYQVEPPQLLASRIVRRAAFETPKDIRNAFGKIRDVSSSVSLSMAQYMKKTHDKNRDNGSR